MASRPQAARQGRRVRLHAAGERLLDRLRRRSDQADPESSLCRASRSGTRRDRATKPSSQDGTVARADAFASSPGDAGRRPSDRVAACPRRRRRACRQQLAERLERGALGSHPSSRRARRRPSADPEGKVDPPRRRRAAGARARSTRRRRGAPRGGDRQPPRFAAAEASSGGPIGGGGGDVEGTVDRADDRPPGWRRRRRPAWTAWKSRPRRRRGRRGSGAGAPSTFGNSGPRKKRRISLAASRLKIRPGRRRTTRIRLAALESSSSRSTPRLVARGRRGRDALRQPGLVDGSRPSDPGE